MAGLFYGRPGCRPDFTFQLKLGASAYLEGAKDAGKMRAEGKEYVVKDGDVLNFLFNV